LGIAATSMERRGIHTERGDELRERNKVNQSILEQGKSDKIQDKPVGPKNINTDSNAPPKL